MTRAVLFDLDDTLFDHQGCAREALAAVQREHDALRTLTFESLERAHAGFLEELHLDVMLGRVPIESARIERFRRLLEALGAADAGNRATGLAAIYRETYRGRRRAVAGAAALMAAIKRRATLGIVSNNLLDEQQDKLRACGLEEFVDALVVSEEVGVSKPDPAIFRVALDRLHVRADDAVMVGDSCAADVEGALAAGIRAIWFNPSGAAAPHLQASVRQLRTLEPADAVTRIILEPNRH